MVNRSKNIGTAAETAVVRYLNTNGWGSAERRALRGNQDAGDITGTPGVCWEIKGGEAAKTASDGQLAAWLHETELERARDNAAVGLLIVQRHRKNVRDWWVVSTIAPLCWLITGHEPPPDYAAVVVRTTLLEIVTVLRGCGYGDPIDEVSSEVTHA
jgi:hypothetical protein